MGLRLQDPERWRAGLVDSDGFGDPELPHGERFLGGVEVDGVGGRREDALGRALEPAETTRNSP
jgi:hypothetical protein